MNQMYFRSLLIVFTFLFLVSCGGKNKSSEDNSQDDFLKANQIIIYTNKVIGDANHMHEWSESNERYVMKLSELAQKPSLIKSHSNITFFLSNSMLSFIDAKTSNGQLIDLRSIPNALDVEDKEFFESSAVAYYDAKDGLKDMYAKVKKYINEEDFKDDQGVLGRAYSDSVKAYYMTMMITISEMSDAAVELGQEAEMLTLSDSPLKDAILVMRGQMKLSSRLLSGLKEYQDGEMRKEDVIQLHDEYVSDYEKMVSKSNDFKFTEKQRRYFDKFLRTSETLKGHFKVAVRDLQNEGKLQYSTISSCEIYNNSLVQDYNNVVG